LNFDGEVHELKNVTTNKPVEFLAKDYYDEHGKYEVSLSVQLEGATPPLEEGIKREVKVGWFIVESPVDISATGPEGLTVSKQVNEIPESNYMEIDLNGDGHPDGIIGIVDLKIGDYLINVTPKPGASPTNTYTLKAFVNGVEFVLAQDVQIKNIPKHPYIVRVTKSEAIPIIPATVDFDPDTSDLKSKGKWVTGYIELPVGHGYAVSQINVSSIRLNGTVPALAKPTEIGDHDKDGVPDLMVKFDRAAVQAILQVGDNVEITVNGSLLDSRQFEGKDSIRVKN
jgi:hypothetical protein